MMKSIAIAMAALAITGAASSSTAAISVLNFDTFADGTIVTTQYDGVTFDGALVLMENGYLDSNFPPFSAPNVISNSQNSGILLTFSGPVSSVGAYVTGDQTIIEYGVDSTGFSFTSALTDGANDLRTGLPQNKYISVSGGGTNISSVLFENVIGLDSFTFTLDDVTVNGAPIALRGDVPEPAAWALMLVGFAALGGALRGRREASAAT